MKHFATLFLISCFFNPAVILAESVEPEFIENSENSVEEIPWDFMPGENLPEEDDDDDIEEQPTQEYNVNININQNQQPYNYGPYYYPGIRRGFFPDDHPPRKPSKPEAFRRPWMPAGKPTKR